MYWTKNKQGDEVLALECSGRALYPSSRFFSVIGIDDDGTLYGGGEISELVTENDGSDQQELTCREKAELAAEMIQRWTKVLEISKPG